MRRRHQLLHPRRWLEHSLVRFLLVGGCGELLYFALFMAASRAGLDSRAAVVIAGAICLGLNAVLHARISFRVKFRWTLLIDYLLIQVAGLLMALSLAWIMQRQQFGTALIGLGTMVLWACCSFLLTRWRFQRPGRPDSDPGASPRDSP